MSGRTFTKLRARLIPLQETKAEEEHQPTENTPKRYTVEIRSFPSEHKRLFFLILS
jgi:hypothetical protein